MKLQTFEKRTAPYRGTKALQMVKDWIRTGKPIRPCYTTGTGKWARNSDHTRTVHDILFVLNAYPTKDGNDAPRGGATGAYIIPAKWGKFAPIREAWAKEQEANQRQDELKEQARLRMEADRYASLVGDHHAVLLAWWEAKEYHPAPRPVMDAKAATGMTWGQIRDFCRANCS